MGLFGGWRKKKTNSKKEDSSAASSSSSANPSLEQQKQPSVPDTSVFEFGSAGNVGEEPITIAGYCPVSNDLEPCRWELTPAPSSDTTAPLFRIIF